MSVSFPHRGCVAADAIRYAVASHTSKGMDWKSVAMGAANVAMIVPSVARSLSATCCFTCPRGGIVPCRGVLTKTGTKCSCPEPEHYAHEFSHAFPLGVGFVYELLLRCSRAGWSMVGQLGKKRAVLIDGMRR